MTHTANTQDEFGLRIAARLNSASLDLPHDISERLRAARTRAVHTALANAPSWALFTRVQRHP